MNIIDRLLKPGYLVTDAACNASCYQVEGEATKYLNALDTTTYENDIVILEIDYVKGFIHIHKPDIEESIKLEIIVSASPIN